MRGGGLQPLGTKAAIIDKPGLLNRFGLESAAGLSHSVTGFVAKASGADGSDECIDIWDVGPDTITSDEEDGIIRPKRGHGRVGRGAPVTLEQGISTRHFEDGAGLCSPGRWQPEARMRDPIASKLYAAIRDIVMQYGDPCAYILVVLRCLK